MHSKFATITVGFVAVTEIDDVIDGRVEDLKKIVNADKDIYPLKINVLVRFFVHYNA
jgi:hypothetical protein